MFFLFCYFSWALLVETLVSGREDKNSSLRKESLFLKKPVIYLVNVICDCQSQCDYPQQPVYPNQNPNPSPPIEPPDYDPSADPGDFIPTTSQPFPPPGQPSQPPSPDPGTDNNLPPGRLDISGNGLSAQEQDLIHQAILASLHNFRSDGSRVRFVTVFRPFNRRAVLSRPFLRIGQFSRRRRQKFRGRMAIEQPPQTAAHYNIGRSHIVSSTSRNSILRPNNTGNPRRRHQDLSFDNYYRLRTHRGPGRG